MPWVLLALVGLLLAGIGSLGVDRFVFVVAVGLQAIFVAFFARHLAFAVSALRSAPEDLDRETLDDGPLPTVSVLVACRNERTVVDRLVTSLSAVEYPADRIEFLVVDDGSDDGTGDELDRLSGTEGRLRCIRRSRGAGGGKSGALNAALAHVTGEIVVVFDADHQPRPDSVRRLVRHFRDPSVGAVQGRCEVTNGSDSFVARLVAIDYLGGYLVNEYGRQSLHQLPAYGGANCAVRASSLRSIGGWNTASVTEDTDLTLRLVLRGERIRYDPSAVDAEEGVVTLGRFARQRYRWARGHQEVWRTFRRSVWTSHRLSLAEKIELTMFLLVFHLPVASAAGLGIFTLWTSGLERSPGGQMLFVFWTFLFLGPLLELAGGMLVGRTRRKDAFLLVFFLPLFFVSMGLCTKAWVDGILGRPYAWVKTKRASEANVPRAVAVAESGVPA